MGVKAFILIYVSLNLAYLPINKKRIFISTTVL